MRKILFVFGMCMLSGEMLAACPDKFVEVHMDNIVITDVGESCPTGLVEYYEIDSICNAHVY